MGSRIGFCTEDKSKERSPIFRQQWKCSIEEAVSQMWKTLGGKPDDGGQAIRDDLENGRAFAALVRSIYTPPFESIQLTTNCDISDNGLITIDITDYKHWIVYHEEVEWETGKTFDKQPIAEMSINGFKWLITEEARHLLGEGLD